MDTGGVERGNRARTMTSASWRATGELSQRIVDEEGKVCWRLLASEEAQSPTRATLWLTDKTEGVVEVSVIAAGGRREELIMLDRDGAGEARIAREPPRTLLVGGLTSLRPRQLEKLGVSSSTERLFAFRFDAVEDAARCFDRLDPWSNTGSPLSFARATGQGDGDDDPEDAPDPVPVPVPVPVPEVTPDPDPSPLSMVVDTASPRPTDETATNIPSSEPVKTPPRTHPSESAKTPPVPTLPPVPTDPLEYAAGLPPDASDAAVKSLVREMLCRFLSLDLDDEVTGVGSERESVVRGEFSAVAARRYVQLVGEVYDEMLATGDVDVLDDTSDDDEDENRVDEGGEKNDLGYF